MTASAPQHRVLARWTGFCASCPEETTLVLVETGPHGLRGWLSGAGPEDRALSYVCAVCGRVEHVPASEEEDELYDASLLRWPDWEPEAAAVSFELEPVLDPYVEPVAAPVLVVLPDVPRRPGTVRVATLPRQRVSATDVLLAAA
jgi:hypothetical protein